MSDDRQTDELDPKDTRVSWPVAIAALGQLGDWTIHALRVGTLAMMRQHLEYAAHPGASPIVIDNLRKFVEALAHMPWKYEEEKTDGGSS